MCLVEAVSRFDFLFCIRAEKEKFKNIIQSLKLFKIKELQKMFQKVFNIFD